MIPCDANNDTGEDSKGLHLRTQVGHHFFIQAVHSNPSCPNATLVHVVELQEDVKEVQVAPDAVLTLTFITEEPTV